MGYVGGVINPRGSTTIEKMKNKPGDYDLVIIGTPIWWYSLAPAVKTYLEKYKPKRVAFFYTCAVDNKITAFKDMEKICGKKPVASLRIDKTDMKDLENLEKVNEFVNRISTFI